MDNDEEVEDEEDIPRRHPPISMMKNTMTKRNLKKKKIHLP
jgi:hypothetical protein